MAIENPCDIYYGGSMKKLIHHSIRVLCLACLLALTLCSVSCALFGDKATPLFDGKTLNGWTVIDCEAEVDNGEIFLKEGNGLVQTEKQYGNFVLAFSWIALQEDKWDSGVYFRYDKVPEGRPWPRRYQVNLRYDMAGFVSALPDARCKGLVKPGEWNHFILTVNGTKASLVINGQPAWTAQGLEGPEKGYIALQAEVPKGGRYRFKDIYITELP